MRRALRLRTLWQERRYKRAFPRRIKPGTHALPGELIISLTSYPPRFAALDCTLRSLLMQTIRPDRIVLWIAESDRQALPICILNMPGIDIRFVPDLRSYKKLVFALEAFPEAFIVTCDDDNFYTPDWLAELVAGWNQSSRAITCHRAHRILENGSGLPVPYAGWDSDTQDAAARVPCGNILPTGLGGILYPPHSLHPDVMNVQIFQSLCPDADDLWFYCQARRADYLYRKVGARFPCLYWPSSQDHSLYATNLERNDIQLRALVDCYGWPFGTASEWVN